jgi:hypothetical protein
MEGDPIEEYLDQLRASLRTPPGQTRLILAEAEDHLRESIAAGRAAGLTEPEAQQAAISSFGSVRAVVRAHQARHGPAAATAGAVALAAGRLASVYLLAVFASGLAWQLFSGLAWRLLGVSPIGTAQPMIATARPICARVLRMHLHCLRGIAPAAPAVDVHPQLAWLAAGAAGLALLGGFALIRRYQRRRGPARPAPLGGYFPLAGAVALVILAGWVLRFGKDLPDAGIAAFAALAAAASYTIRMAGAIPHRPRGSADPA